MATTFAEPGSDATFGTEFYTSTELGGDSTVVSDTSQFRTGTRSIKCTSDSANNGNARARIDGVMADAGTRVSAGMRFTDFPTAGNDLRVMISNNTADTLDVVAVRITSGGVLRLYNDTVQIGGNGATLSTAKWYRLCLAYTVTSTTVYEMRLFVDGVLSISISNGGALTGTGGTFFRIGWGNDAYGASKVIHFDDVYIDNSSALTDTGDVHVTAKRPNANGTTVGFTTQIGVGGSGYGSGHSPQVNERALSTTNGWSMIGAGSAVTEEYNIEADSVGDVNVPSTAIVDYVGWVYAKSLVAETAQIIVNNATSNIALTSTNTMFTKVAGSTTYPAGTGTDIGIITDTSLTTVSLYEAGIIFAYKIRVPKNTRANPLGTEIGMGWRMSL